MSSDTSTDFIPLAVPFLGGNESKYVNDCLDTNWVSYVGSYVSDFEAYLAGIAGAAEAVAVTSGTAALHMALSLAGVTADTDVVMPGISFVAPANAIRYCGAWPVFVDIAERDWQMDPAAVADFFDSQCERRPGGGVWNRATGRRVSAVAIVHLLGGLGNSEAILGICEKHCLPLIEDIAECIGARWTDRPLCASASASATATATATTATASGDPVQRIWATSFNGNKIATTGGGGAVLTNDRELAARLRHLTTTAKTDGLTFYHDQLGYNLRLTNIAAAMGLAQLERLDFHVSEKRRIAGAYQRAFAGDPRIRTHPEPDGSKCCFWLYTIMLDRDALPVVKEMNRQGIGCRPIWHPMADLPYLDEAYSHGLAFGAEFHRRALSLPCSVGLSEQDQDRVIRTLRDCLES